MLAKLSHFSRVITNHFVRAWMAQSPKPIRTPTAVAREIDAENSARARNDCRAIGAARARKYQARLEGLKRERENGQFPKGAYQ